jgi:hypothetical protein
MTEIKRSQVKPGLDTPFHIDFSWWRQNDREWLVYLRSMIDADYRKLLDTIDLDEPVDWVDPETAEVKQMDAVQYLLMAHLAEDHALVGEGTSMVESVFRIFLKNGNLPLDAQQLGNLLNRPAQTILRTLAGVRVYRGIRPVVE